MLGNIKEIADNYERNYGFMCVNATMKHAKMFDRVHYEDDGEMKLVHDELIKRGHEIIRTEKEYNDGVAAHGVPPAFRVVGT